MFGKVPKEMGRNRETELAAMQVAEKKLLADRRNLLQRKGLTAAGGERMRLQALRRRP
jgi:hypothetical protein